MKFGLKPLDVLFLLIGSAILFNEIFITQSLTVTELGAALFFFGLTAAAVADREGTTGPIEFLQLVADIFRGTGGSRRSRSRQRDEPDGKDEERDPE